jgi:hypothetical protein
MNVPSPDENALPFADLAHDTWVVDSDVAAWILHRPSKAARSAWLLQATRFFLTGFAGFARPFRIRINFLSTNQQILREAFDWQPGTSAKSFVENAVARAQDCGEALMEVSVDLDLALWAVPRGRRTPLHVWVRLPTEFVASNPSSGGWAAFHLHHSLLCPASLRGQQNSELYRLNQPLLEQALARWECMAGAELEYEGRCPQTFRHGFRAR